jgi:hypothetical protein
MLLGSRQIATANGHPPAKMRVRLGRVADIRQHLRNAINVWHSDCVGRTGTFGPGGSGRRTGGVAAGAQTIRASEIGDAND